VNGPGVTGPLNNDANPANDENVSVDSVCVGRGSFIMRLGFLRSGGSERLQAGDDRGEG
jgi:hypothetical protein